MGWGWYSSRSASVPALRPSPGRPGRCLGPGRSKVRPVAAWLWPKVDYRRFCFNQNWHQKWAVFAIFGEDCHGDICFSPALGLNGVFKSFKKPSFFHHDFQVPARVPELVSRSMVCLLTFLFLGKGFCSTMISWFQLEFLCLSPCLFLFSGATDTWVSLKHGLLLFGVAGVTLFVLFLNQEILWTVGHDRFSIVNMFIRL